MASMLVHQNGFIADRNRDTNSTTVKKYRESERHCRHQKQKKVKKKVSKEPKANTSKE